MKSGLLLDIIIRQGPAILQLFASEDESLLIWRNTLLILDFSLHVLNGVAGLDLQGDGLTSQSFHKDLHFDTEKKTFYLNIIFYLTIEANYIPSQNTIYLYI